MQKRSSSFSTIKLLFSLLVSFGCIAPSLADTSVWQITSGSNTLYLGGTVHLLRPSDFPLPEEFEQAYQASSTIVFETDLSSMTGFAVQAQMLQELTYNDERTLRSVLNDEAYTALSEYATTSGMPLMLLEKFKPGMVVSTLQVLEFQKMGFTPQGVDAYFNNKAIAEGKTLGQLESVADQIGFLAKMGEGNESEFILLSLSDLDETEAMMEEMIRAWRSGDNGLLSEMFVEDMRTEAPELYDSLLLGRNLNWLPQIEAMLSDATTEFVLVGAAHLVGQGGLLQLLEARGYQVKQL